MIVLVVDDSSSVRARVAAMLREISAVEAVREAASGEAAMIELRACTYDMIVLDLHLPGVSGLALLPDIVALPARPTIVVLTNQSGDQLRRQCLALGADYFFDKSRDIDLVVDVVTESATARTRRRSSTPSA